MNADDDIAAAELLLWLRSLRTATASWPQPQGARGPPLYLGRKRVFDGNQYGPWVALTARGARRRRAGIELGDGNGTSSRPFVLPLHRGGAVHVWPGFLAEDRRRQLAAALLACRLWRQYTIGTREEPRVHVLLGRRRGEGYKYHNVTLQAYPMGMVPEVARLVADSEELLGGEFNIGADLLCYRDGNDSCGWHADDTQGELRVLCCVVESAEPRSIRFRPKLSAAEGGGPLREGDEELDLEVAEGDAYAFDGGSQLGYEHQLPKRPGASRRTCIILREGSTVAVPRDTGVPAPLQLAPRPEAAGPRFGQIPGLLELALYRRMELVREPLRAHSSDRRGISGIREVGADAVVLSWLDRSLAQHDGLTWLTYTTSARQGGGAMLTSLRRRLPIRVFRSSTLGPPFGPPTANRNGKGPATYRYDGLYRILGAWDERGRSVAAMPSGACAGAVPGLGILVTFRLARCSGGGGGGGVEELLPREDTVEELPREDMMEGSSAGDTAGAYESLSLAAMAGSAEDDIVSRSSEASSGASSGFGGGLGDCGGGGGGSGSSGASSGFGSCGGGYGSGGGVTFGFEAAAAGGADRGGYSSLEAPENTSSDLQLWRIVNTTQRKLGLPLVPLDDDGGSTGCSSYKAVTSGYNKAGNGDRSGCSGVRSDCEDLNDGSGGGGGSRRESVRDVCAAVLNEVIDVLSTTGATHYSASLRRVITVERRWASDSDADGGQRFWLRCCRCSKWRRLRPPPPPPPPPLPLPAPPATAVAGVTGAPPLRHETAGAVPTPFCPGTAPPSPETPCSAEMSPLAGASAPNPAAGGGGAAAASPWAAAAAAAALRPQLAASVAAAAAPGKFPGGPMALGQLLSCPTLAEAIHSPGSQAWQPLPSPPSAPVAAAGLVPERAPSDGCFAAFKGTAAPVEQGMKADRKIGPTVAPIAPETTEAKRGAQLWEPGALEPAILEPAALVPAALEPLLRPVDPASAALAAIHAELSSGGAAGAGSMLAISSWQCRDNVWDPRRRSCLFLQEAWDDGDRRKTTGSKPAAAAPAAAAAATAAAPQPQCGDGDADVEAEFAAGASGSSYGGEYPVLAGSEAGAAEEDLYASEAGADRVSSNAKGLARGGASGKPRTKPDKGKRRLAAAAPAAAAPPETVAQRPRREKAVAAVAAAAAAAAGGRDDGNDQDHSEAWDEDEDGEGSGNGGSGGGGKRQKDGYGHRQPAPLTQQPLLRGVDAGFRGSDYRGGGGDSPMAAWDEQTRPPEAAAAPSASGRRPIWKNSAAATTGNANMPYHVARFGAEAAAGAESGEEEEEEEEEAATVRPEWQKEREAAVTEAYAAGGGGGGGWHAGSYGDGSWRVGGDGAGGWHGGAAAGKVEMLREMKPVAAG